jgi:hypothetical protein
MFMRITRGQFDLTRIDESIAISQDVGDAIAQLPGLVRYHGGINRETGAIAAVSVWDTEEHARSTRETLGNVLARLQAVGASLEPPDIFEIVVDR